MRVLVTGGAGCLGTELCLLLQERGHQAVAVDNGSRYQLLGEKGCREFEENYRVLTAAGVKLLRGDFRDLHPEELDSVDAVVHAAAQVCHSRRHENPAGDVEINVLGTVRLLDEVKRRGLPFLFISSSKLYGENFDRPNWGHVDESCPIGDQTWISFFGASKAAADLFCQMYAKGGMTVGVFRPGCFTSRYALAAEAQNWIPWLHHCKRTGVLFRVFGGGEQVRDLLHTRDLAEACLLWLERPTSGVWNVGGGLSRVISVNEAVERVGAMCVMMAPRPGDIQRLVIDSGRFARDYSWRPTRSLDDIFKEFA